MISISEWLPDAGQGSAGQWFELFNNGTQPVDLAGWRLQTTAKKPVALSGRIGPGAYLVLKKADLKFSFRKTDGQLALIDPEGQLRDFIYFHGQAPRYQSANRSGAGAFFGKPTPGAPNVAESSTLIADKNPIGVALPGTASTALPGSVFGMAFGTALLLAFVAVFVFTNHDDISELFIGRH